MKLICFDQHQDALARLLGPALASVGELVTFTNPRELRKLEPGDVLVVYSGSARAVVFPDRTLEEARDARLVMWSVSDHWVELPAVDVQTSEVFQAAPAPAPGLTAAPAPPGDNSGGQPT